MRGLTYRRTQGGVLARTEGEGTRILEARFAPLNGNEYVVPGWWREVYGPECCDESLAQVASGDRQVAVLNSHNRGQVIASTASGTALSKKDGDGYYGSGPINGTSWADNTYIAVENKDVTGTSAGFRIVRQHFEDDDEGKLTLWTLDEIELHEYSYTAFPAYSDTTAIARQLEDLMNRQRDMDSTDADDWMVERVEHKIKRDERDKKRGVDTGSAQLDGRRDRIFLFERAKQRRTKRTN